MNFYYGEKRALDGISMRIHANRVTAFIGPSGCGKSTFLRTLNRMNDIIPGTRVEGQVLIDGRDVYGPGVDVVSLRRQVGMVFQKSNPFPKSIFENVAYGLRINGLASSKAELADRVEESLRAAALWDEVKDRLSDSALALSGGQQQRLCIARALAIRPEVLLMDEPASALDPIATQRIEELIFELKKEYTIVIVTHNMQQAARVSDHTAFFWLGRLVEYDRDRSDLHGAGREADRGLHHRPVRIAEEAAVERVVRHFQEELVTLQERLLAMGGFAEERVREAVRGLCDARRRAGRPGAERRRADQRPAHRDRRPLLQAAGAAPADGRRPAGHRRRGEDQHRPRARRRPGGEHRRGRPSATCSTRRSSRSSTSRGWATSPSACCATRSTPSSAATWRWPRRCWPPTTSSTRSRSQIFRELLTYMMQDAQHHRAGARPHPGVAPPRAHRRPRHQRRRGRDLHGLGARRAPSRPGGVGTFLNSPWGRMAPMTAAMDRPAMRGPIRAPAGGALA